MACIIILFQGTISQAVMVHQSTSSPSHEAFMDGQQRTPLLTPIESKPGTGMFFVQVQHSLYLEFLIVCRPMARIFRRGIYIDG